MDVSIDLGDVPGWIGAGVGLGGVAYGAFSIRRLRYESEREQADLVYFGFEFDDNSSRVHLINLSAAPLRDVEIVACEWPSYTRFDTARRPFVRPGESFTVTLRTGDSDFVVCACSFTDAHAKRWTKNPDGFLYSYKTHPGWLTQNRYWPGPLQRIVRTFGKSEAGKQAWDKVNQPFWRGYFRWATKAYPFMNERKRGRHS